MRRLPALVLLLNTALAGGMPSAALAQEPESVEQVPTGEPAARERPAPQTRGDALAAGLQRQLERTAQIELGSDDSFLALWQPANTQRPVACSSSCQAKAKPPIGHAQSDRYDAAFPSTAGTP